MSNIRSYECFLCGKNFLQSESLAANTTELMSNTYCSRVCEDTDKEQIDKDIKEEQARLASIEEEYKKQNTPNSPTGFNLKVNL